MMEDITCCEPVVSTFLATTRVRPIEYAHYEKTEAEKRLIEKQLIDCIRHPKEIPLDL